MVVPFTSCRAQISLPSTKVAWSGDCALARRCHHTEYGSRDIGRTAWATAPVAAATISVAFTVATQAGKNTISSTIQTVADRT